MKKLTFPIWYRLIFIIVCVGINFGTGMLSKALMLPFWFDTIGTGISACVLGPVAGAITGFLSNLLSGAFDSINLGYCLINAVIGILIGLFFKYGMYSNFFSVLCTGIVIGVVSALCSTPFNCILYDGYTGNIWGDSLFNMLSQYQRNIVFNSFVSELFIDIPDKVISMIIIFYLLKLMKKTKKYNDMER